MLSYYTAEPVTERVTAIRSLTGEILYLVRGRDRAILIDTGVGVRGLRALVESLTDKPLTVLLTHGHVDHAMGAGEFDEVHLNILDLPVYREMAGLEVRREYIAMGLGERVQMLEDGDFVSPFPVNVRAMNDGEVFDAGDLQVQALHFPGHTPGMTAFLIVDERVLVLGDGCNQRTFMFDHNSVSVEEYRDNVVTLDERTRGRYDRVFITHGVIDVPVTILGEASRLCDEVLAGHSDEVPFEFLGHHALVARAFDEQTGARRDGGFFNLVYDPARLHRA